MNRSSLVKQESLLLEAFQEFYYETLRQKEKALRLSESSDPTQTEAVVVELVTKIQSKLIDLLDHQKKKFPFQAGKPALKSAHYIMAALADDVFLTLKWSGVKAWENSLLEKRLFQTQRAGELFFQNLDDLLKAHDSSQMELAYLYFLALSLGFRGPYREESDQDKIQGYLDQLYGLLQGHGPTLFHKIQEGRLAPSCYDYTATELSTSRLPDIRAWSLCIGGILGAYLFFTYVLWYGFASDLHQVLDTLFKSYVPQGL